MITERKAFDHISSRQKNQSTCAYSDDVSGTQDQFSMGDYPSYAN